MSTRFRSEVFLQQDLAALLSAIEQATYDSGATGEYAAGHAAALRQVRIALHIEPASDGLDIWREAMAEAEHGADDARGR